MKQSCYIAALTLAMFGCGRDPLGPGGHSYGRKDNSLSERIVFQTNGLYSQTVTYSDGRKYEFSGDWRVTNDLIRLEPFNCTFDSMSGKTLPQPRWFSFFSFQLSGDFLDYDADRGYSFQQLRDNAK
jgi:hypothetical protein